MTKAKVKRALRERGLTYWKLSRKWRCTSAAVSNVINGKLTSLRLERRLAKELGLSVEQLRSL